MANQFFGKYRALVVDTKDPEKMGRIKVRCPNVLGEYTSNWCVPCVPCAFDDGGMFYIPKEEEVVWVEFEGGNPNKPIWTGSWWIPKRTPMQEEDNITDKIMFISRGQHIIEIDDKENTIIIKMKDGTRFKMGEGVEVTAPEGKKITFFGDVEMKNKLLTVGEVEFKNKTKILGEVTVQNNVKISETMQTKVATVTDSATITNSLKANSIAGQSMSEGGQSLSSKYALKSEACKCS